MFLPFEIQEDAITITFDLARWIQHKWVEEKYGKVTYGDRRSFIVKAKFSRCKNIAAKDALYDKFEKLAVKYAESLKEGE